MLHIPIVHAHDVSKQIPWEKKLPTVWKCYKTIGSYISCVFIEIWSTWEVWRALKKLELLSATPWATLTHLSCSPNFPCASYLDESTLKYEPIVEQNTAHDVLYDNEWNFDPNNWKHLFPTFDLKDELSETLFQRENLALLRVRWWFQILWSVIWTKSHLFSMRKYRSALSVPSGVCRGIQTFTSVRYNHSVPKTRHSH